MKRRKADSDDEPVEAAIANKRIKQPIAVLGPTFSDEEDDSSDFVGRLFVLGQGDCGQLGKGEDFTEARNASEASLGQNNPKVRDIAAGGVHSLAIDDQCYVYSCGVNDEGALGRRTDNKIWETEQASSLNAPESRDDFEWERVPVPLSNGLPQSVSAGDSHSAVLTDCGSIWGWGTFRDSGGVYGFQPDCKISLLPKIVYQPQSWARVTQIASGTDHMLALMESGKVLSWGTGGQGQLGRITKAEFQELSRAKHKFKMLQQEIENIEEKIKEAEDNAKAKLEQELAGVRPNFESASRLYKPLEKQMRQNQLTPKEVNIPARIVSISCGWYNSFAVDDTGKVWAFGLDNYGQSSAAKPSTQPKKLDEEEERYIYAPERVAGLSKFDIVKIAGGNQHTLALTRAGNVLSFGRTTYGRLGRLNDDYKSNTARESPAFVDGLYQVEADSIAAGEEVSACISKTGAAFLWGSGTNAQLGNVGKNAGLRNAGLDPEERTAKNEDDTLDEIIPCRLDISAFKGKKSQRVEFGGQHTLILRED